MDGGAEGPTSRCLCGETSEKAGEALVLCQRASQRARVMSCVVPRRLRGGVTNLNPCLARVGAHGSVEGINVQSHEVIRIGIGLFIIAFLDDGEVPCIARPFAKFGGAIRAE